MRNYDQVDNIVYLQLRRFMKWWWFFDAKRWIFAVFEHNKCHITESIIENSSIKHDDHTF